MSRLLDWVHEEDAVCGMLDKAIHQYCADVGDERHAALMGVLATR